MLIIDEIQHVLAGPLLRQRAFLNVIKHLGNEMPFSDVQLGNRFEPATGQLLSWRPHSIIARVS